MAKAVLLKDNEFIRVYRSAKGKRIILKLAEDYSEIIIKDLQNNQLGEFEFKELGINGYKLMRMDCNNIKKEGVGRAVLEFFKDITGGPIYASPHDGHRREDGSHLTDDAPKFVYKMIQEGLIDGYDDGSDGEDFDNGFF